MSFRRRFDRQHRRTRRASLERECHICKGQLGGPARVSVGGGHRLCVLCASIVDAAPTQEAAVAMFEQLFLQLENGAAAKCRCGEPACLGTVFLDATFTTSGAAS